MYKLVLVDDNEFVLEGFREKINLKGLGIELSGVASNGAEALELIQTIGPDILVTDIKMPKMTGMELIEAIRSTNRKMKVVILSGYSDFEYARKAISLNTAEYLLKPILKSDIESALAKIVESLKSEETEALRHERIEARSRQNSEIVKSHVISGLLEGRADDREKVLGLLSAEDIDFRDKKAVAALMEPAPGSLASGDADAAGGIMNGLLSTALTAAGEDSIGILAGERRAAFISFYDRFLDDGEIDESFRELLLAVRDAVKADRGISTTISAGLAVPGLLDIRESFQQACEAMGYRLIFGVDSVIMFSSIAARKAGKSVRFDESMERILNAVKKRDRDGIGAAIDGFFSGIASHCDCAPPDVINASYRLALAAGEIEHDIAASAREAALWEQLNALDSLEGIRGWVRGLYTAAFQTADSRTRYSQIVTFVIDAVERNYAKELLLKDIAREMYISENYLTTLFKRETGVSFKKYMTNVRMQKAAALLLNPKYKVYEVASLVGYDSEEHFCRMFKENKGMTPKEFRNSGRSVISDGAEPSG